MAAKRKSPSPLVAVAPPKARRLAGALLDWYDREKRDLPWRHTDDPYAILVSECMLQQTQVATVLPYYRRFLKRFPDVQSLARAGEEEVLREWAGLGYYSRARNLHKSARKIVEENGGCVPSSFAELLFLPGVGRYVAGAVSSIAFGLAQPAVDANVLRVLSRLLGIRELPGSTRARQDFEETVRQFIPPERAGDFNQALMELGALVCPASAPRCGACPWAAHCEARASGEPEAFPAAPPRRESVAVEEACAVVEQAGCYLVVQRPEAGGRYRNMWEFPALELEPDADAAGALRTYLKKEYGLRADRAEEWAEIRHQVTHHKIRKRVFRLAVETAPQPDADEGRRWANLEELEALPLAAPQKRILALLRQEADFFSA